MALVLSQGFASRRNLQKDLQINQPVNSRYAEKPEALPTRYEIRERASSLHRNAAVAFLEGHFNESEEAFSLGYQRDRTDLDLLTDYILCAIHFPDGQRSLPRIANLLKETETLTTAPTVKLRLCRQLYSQLIQEPSHGELKLNQYLPAPLRGKVDMERLYPLPHGILAYFLADIAFAGRGDR